MANSNVNNNVRVLVTGGTDFIGVHCVLQLLEQGYQVRTTIRSITKRAELYNMLRNGGISSFASLQITEANLMDDRNWEEAVTGCEYVLHVAAPIGLRPPKDENDLVRPAVEGTLRVLRFARDAGVKRVVSTSNFGAVGYSHNDRTTIITEECWTDPEEKGLSTYNRSKTLAEQAAWKFMCEEGGALELAVINPVGIFGPSLGPEFSSGFQLLKQIIDGTIRRVPNMTLGIVDVRDVADLHIRAMLSPDAKGQRFLAIAGEIMTLREIALLLAREFGDQFPGISTKPMPDWVVRLVAPFSRHARQVLPNLGRYRTASNEKARRLLGWNPRSNEDALLATALSLVQFSGLRMEDK